MALTSTNVGSIFFFQADPGCDLCHHHIKREADEGAYQRGVSDRDGAGGDDLWEGIDGNGQGVCAGPGFTNFHLL
jgi:hypothetical protein